MIEGVIVVLFVTAAAIPVVGFARRTARGKDSDCGGCGTCPASSAGCGTSLGSAADRARLRNPLIPRGR